MNGITKGDTNASIRSIGWVDPLGNEGSEEHKHLCAICYTHAEIYQIFFTFIL